MIKFTERKGDRSHASANTPIRPADITKPLRRFALADVDYPGRSSGP